MSSLIQHTHDTVCDFAQVGDADREGVQLFTITRQLACYLKKMCIDRADLREEAVRKFLEKEQRMYADTRAGLYKSEAYLRDMDGMRDILNANPIPLDWTKFVPCHGGGAVADKEVKSWLGKYLAMSPDARIAYLLQHSDLGTENEYAPFVTGNVRSKRTSRFIAVPKTWKTLRGISAEPAELQFWQHGLLAVVDVGLRRSIFWRNCIDLHNQTKSQKLSLSGSVTRDFGTIDLSEASDSVSLQLVRDLFGNSELGRWLLGTRSISTEYDKRGHRVKLCKFAPMGSSMCFPVECIVFALAAKLAVNRTIRPNSRRKQVQVYGDDIVVPSYAFDECVSILEHLGFTVNTDKSFNTGFFRESCGTEAWKGVDIAPVRYKSVPFSAQSTVILPEILSSTIALANGLFIRGMRLARADLLQAMSSKFVNVSYSRKDGSTRTIAFPVQMAYFCTFLGANSTLASPMPTNFHVKRRYERNIQTIVYDVIRWKVGGSAAHVEESLLSCYDACRLVEWLIRHQPLSADEADEPLVYQCAVSAEERLANYLGFHVSSVDFPKVVGCLTDVLLETRNGPQDVDEVLVAAKAVNKFLKSFVHVYQEQLKRDLDPYARLPIGNTLIPYRKWVDASYLSLESIPFRALEQ